MPQECGFSGEPSNDGLTMVVLHGALAWMIWNDGLIDPVTWAAFALTLAVSLFHWAMRGRIDASGGLLPAGWSKRSRMLFVGLICFPLGVWHGWQDAGSRSNDPVVWSWIAIGLSVVTLTMGIWRLLHDRRSPVR